MEQQTKFVLVGKELHGNGCGCIPELDALLEAFAKEYDASPREISCDSIAYARLRRGVLEFDNLAPTGAMRMPRIGPVGTILAEYMDHRGVSIPVYLRDLEPNTLLLVQ